MFDGKIEFDVTPIPYNGNDDWVEGIIVEARACLNKDKVPEPSKNCDYCRYREDVDSVIM